MKRSLPSSNEPPYSGFAQYYDEAMGDQSAKITLLKGLVAEYAPTARKILELACGTGTILEGFSNNFLLTGIDLSPEMLSIARTKAPSAKLLKGDMRNFTLDEQYDVVLCIFNSINHLTNFSDWLVVFRRAWEHLLPDGIFIFDVNTLERLKKISQLSTSYDELSHGELWIELCQIKKQFRWIIHMRPKDSDHEYIETFDEIAVPTEIISTNLERDFKLLEVITKTGYEGEAILYFVAQKI
ncbi:MAG: class I SAM-dependent DNA methyltransferase [Candidatus Saccharimonadia bacterium]